MLYALRVENVLLGLQVVQVIAIVPVDAEIRRDVVLQVSERAKRQVRGGLFGCAKESDFADSPSCKATSASPNPNCIVLRHSILPSGVARLKHGK